MDRVEPPPTLFDYLPADGLLVVDESHVTIPNWPEGIAATGRVKRHWRSMVFRLPSALDNRPLKFEEFESISAANHLCFGDAG